MTVSQSNPAAGPSPEAQTQARNAFRISMVALLVCGLYAGYLFIVAFQVGTVERYRAAVMIGGLALVAAISAWLSRRGRSTLGMILLLSWLYAAVLESPTRQAGQGLLLGFIAVTMTIVVASQTLDRRWSLRMIVASVIVCIGAVLLDTYGSNARPSYGLGAPLVVAAISMAAFLVIIVRQFSSYPLRMKLIVAFLAVSLISIGTIALYANLTIQRALQDQASSQLANVAQLRSTTIGDLLTKEAELLRTISLDAAIREAATASNASYPANQAEVQKAILALDQEWITAANANDDTNPLIRSKLDNSISQYLREFRAAYPENAEVFVTDRYGALLGATNRTSDYYQADEGWWQSTFNNGQGTIYYTQPEYDASSGKFSIDIGVPIYESGGKNINGILRTTVDLSSLVTLLTRAQSNQRSQVDLLLPDNTFLQAQGAVPAPANILAGLSAESTATSEVNWEGVPSFAAIAPLHATDSELGSTINQLNWRIVAHQSSAEVLAPVETQSRTVLIVMALVAALVTGASIGMSQVLVRPITHLTTVATQVAAGDLTARAVVETADEIGTLATTFNSMTAELRTVVTTLEERVQARTAQLRASNEVGRAAASILDTDLLLHEVVNLITDRFGFYYTAVFLADETDQWAVLSEATGEAGRILKERGHRLDLGGLSMVGTVMKTRQPRIALDVGAEAVRFANPLLPATRSEIALPLMIGNRVLGALDVQSTQAAAFDETSAAVLQAMADQITIALNNAHQFKQTELALEYTNTLYATTQILTQAKTTEEVLTAIVNYVGAEANRSSLVTYGPRRDDGEWEYIEFSATWIQPDYAAGLPPLPTGSRFTSDQLPLAHFIKTDQPLVVGDAQSEETPAALRQILQQFGAKAFIALPLIAGENLLGALVIGYHTARTFEANQLQLLTTLAQQIAIVLQNQQSLQASQAALAQLDQANRRLIGEAWQEYADSVGGGVRKVKWGYGTSPDTLSTVLPSVVAAPVVVSGVEVGALRLEDAAADRVWTPTEVSVLQSIASEVSIALERARLIEETEKRAQRERTLNRIAGRIRGAQTVDQVLDIAAEELSLNTSAPRTLIEIEPGREQAGRGNDHDDQ